MIHLMQEIALIFVVIKAFQQAGGSVPLISAHIVSRGDQICTQFRGIIQKRTELNFPITENIRIGGSAGAVLSQKMIKNLVPVLGREVRAVQMNAQLVGNGLRISQVFFSGAVFSAVVFLPVLHEQAFDTITLL